MNKLPSPILYLAVALMSAASVTATAPPPNFAQSTRVEGKLPAGLTGAWFVYAQATFPGGKTRALPPELVTVSPGGGSDMALKILDVQLPKSIDEPYQAGNQARSAKAWEPSAEDLALLRKDWSKLPPATEKDWRKSEVVYERVQFTLASPDKYGEVFPDQGAGIQEAFAGSVFAMEVVEKYRPQQVPAGQNVAQVMERKSMYVVRKVTDSVIEGQQFTGYLAAGPGVPLPITFTGPFRLYRLAKGASGAPAAAPRAKRGGKR